MNDQTRLADLERKNAEMERKLEKLEALTPPAPRMVPLTGAPGAPMVPVPSKFAVPPLAPNVARVDQPLSEEEAKLASEVFTDRGLLNFRAQSLQQGGGESRNEMDRRTREAEEAAGATTLWSGRPGPLRQPQLEEQIRASDKIVDFFEKEDLENQS